MQITIRVVKNDIAATIGKVHRGANRAIRRASHETVTTCQAQTPVDTGELRDSWRETYSDLHAEFGPTANHAGPVEFGTSRMPGRPYFRGGINDMLPRYPGIFRDEIAHEVGR